MKLLNLALIACATASLAACSSEKKSKDASDKDSVTESGYVIEKVSSKDSIAVDSCKAVADCSIDYIKASGDNKTVADSTSAWIRNILAVDKSVTMGAPLAKSVVDSHLQSSKEELTDWVKEIAKYPDDNYPPMSYEFSYSVKPVALTPSYVTMLYNSYVYMGGAHGGAESVGQTFSTKSGLKLTLDNMFKPESKDAVLELVEQGLMKQYFKVSDIKEFENELLLNGDPLPFPANTPYFEDGGVCFLYQQYEIAPYAAGMPACVIPFKTLEPYFSDLALGVIYAE